MKAIRAYFLSRLPREKYLVAGLLFVGAAVWLILFSGQFQVFWRSYVSNRTRLATQSATLERGADVDARAEAAVRTLEPSRTLSSSALIGRLREILGRAGMQNAQANGGADSQGSQFSVHRARVTANQVSWESLVNFYLQLNAQFPYITIEDFQVAPSPAGRGGSVGHNLTVNVVAIERTGP